MVVLRWKADGDYLVGLTERGLARWTRAARKAKPFLTRSVAERWLRRRMGDAYGEVRRAFRVVQPGRG